MRDTFAWIVTVFDEGVQVYLSTSTMTGRFGRWCYTRRKRLIASVVVVGDTTFTEQMQCSLLRHRGCNKQAQWHGWEGKRFWQSSFVHKGLGDTLGLFNTFSASLMGLLRI
jgi:hypothetical protein